MKYSKYKSTVAFVEYVQYEHAMEAMEELDLYKFNGSILRVTKNSLEKEVKVTKTIKKPLLVQFSKNQNPVSETTSTNSSDTKVKKSNKFVPKSRTEEAEWNWEKVEEVEYKKPVDRQAEMRAEVSQNMERLNSDLGVINKTIKQSDFAPSELELMFIMDCTGSMSSWI